MFENIINHFKKMGKKEENVENKKNKDTAKERLHLVLMQDRANVSADFLDMMKQEIIDVIKKYIDVDENSIDVKLTNQQNSDGTTGAPALYANIPIISIKDETRKVNGKFELEKSKEDAKRIDEKNSKTDDEKSNNDVNNNDKEDNNKVKTNKDDIKDDKSEENKSDKQEDNNKENNENLNKEGNKENKINDKTYQVVKPNNKKKNHNKKKR